MAAIEERLSRLKADTGYPQRSIDAVLSIAGIDAKDGDLGTRGYLFQALYKCNATLSVQDWVKQCHKYWKPIS